MKNRVACLVLLLVASSASADTEPQLLRWIHSSPNDVTGWIIHVGNSSGNYGIEINLDKGAATDGVFSAAVPLERSIDQYVVITAVGIDGSAGEDKRSAFSNEKVILALVEVSPGQPFVIPD